MSTATTHTRPTGEALRAARGTPQNLADAVRASVEHGPDRIALRHRGAAVTYAQLWEESSRWLVALQRAGVRPGELVGVCLERTPQLIAGLIAIHRAGSAYVPLDPDYPHERSAFILDDSGAEVVLAQRSTSSVLGDRHVLGAEELPEGPTQVHEEPQASGEDLAYVIYTSGSTGRPKGVLIEHRQVLALIRWGAQAYSAEELGGVLASTSICFDLSVFEIFVTLAAGGTLVLADNALELPALADRDHVVLVNTVPSAMTVLTSHGDLPASVRTVNLAGEPLTRALADSVYACEHVQRVRNLYGPSEDTTYSTEVTVPRDSREEPTIGVPLPGSRAYLLREDGHPVADGEVGELYLGGAGVTRGYLDRPELTAERFLPDPFAPGERMYRTGDLCLLGADGELRYRGRTDHQVKIRGFRVELGEIEATLARHPAVDAAVVVVRSVEHSGPSLVAFVQAPYAEGLPETLTSLVRERLPHYMVPSAIVPLDQLPLTPNGKIDRAALPQVEIAAPVVAGATPETDDERLVAAAWAEVLGLPDTAPVDVAFVDLGGNSLLAASVLHRLTVHTGRRVPLSDFPVGATVRDLAAVLRVAAPTPQAPLDKGATGAGRTYPPAPAQLEFFVLDELTGGRSAVSVMPVRLTVDTELDPALLRRALDLLPRRHDVLCTALSGGSQGVSARVVPPYPVELTVVQTEEDLEGQGTIPLDLTSGRLLAAAMIPPRDGRTDLLLRIHHAACDGWSIRLLLRDLAEVYGDLAAGREPVPVQGVSFPDGAQWLEDARTAHGDALRRYWRDRLAGVDPTVTLPPTRESGTPREVGRPGDVLHHALDPDLMERLGSFIAEHQLTSYAALTALTAIRLHRESGASDVFFRVPVGNRRHPDLEDVIGPFLETSATRIDVSGDPSFVELVRRVADAARADVENSWAASQDILAPIVVTRDAHGRPVGQLLVAVQNYGSARHTVDGLTWTYHSEPTNGSAKTDIGFFWELGVPTGPMLNIEFDTDLHTAAGIARYRDQLLHLLRGALAAPERPISELSWADADELAAVSEHHRVETLVATSSTPELVCAAAAATPDATAVWCPRRGEVSYAQLEHDARALAARVSEVTGGSGPEPVAVACRRGAEGIIAMLATWFVGRPYLPLDTGHPVPRLRDILIDSGALAVVADDSAPEGLADLAPVLASTERGTGAAAPAVASLSDPAYLIYTSGSTGRPKGVRISHGALASFLEAMGEELPVEPGDTITHLTTPSFDIAGLEVWLPLVAGARVAVVDEDTVRDGFALAEIITDTQATLVQMTPSGWSLLLDAGWAGATGIRALVGAEAVPPLLAAQLVERCGQTWNVYGPTEATIWACAHRIRPEDTTGSSVPIGRPLGNTRAWVLDPAGHPVPPGTVGAIHLSGSSLADGYHGREDLTQAAFGIGQHLPGAPRIYRTGDLGRLREDGLLECLGRTDHQVKVRGVRIELDEVDSALRSAPGVSRASSRVLDSGPGSGQLVGYLVPSQSQVSPETVREHVAGLLPAAMVPTLWHVLPELPLNTSGKIDRAALPEPTLAVDVPDDDLTELEEFLAELWLEHLPGDRLAAGTSFFEVGGHSLTATRVVAAVREDLGVSVSVGTLFESPTLRGFASVVETALVEQGSTS